MTSRLRYSDSSRRTTSPRTSPMASTTRATRMCSATEAELGWIIDTRPPRSPSHRTRRGAASASARKQAQPEVIELSPDDDEAHPAADAPAAASSSVGATAMAESAPASGFYRWSAAELADHLQQQPVDSPEAAAALLERLSGPLSGGVGPCVAAACARVRRAVTDGGDPDFSFASLFEAVGRCAARSSTWACSLLERCGRTRQSSSTTAAAVSPATISPTPHSIVFQFHRRCTNSLLPWRSLCLSCSLIATYMRYRQRISWLPRQLRVHWAVGRRQ